MTLEGQQNIGVDIFTASPWESKYRKLTQDKTTFCAKRRLKCQERGSCSLKPKDIRCFAKINSRPIAENLRFRNTKIILLSSQTSKESTSLILDLKISQNPRKVSLCKRRKFPKHLFVLFQENISCFKRIKFFILSQKKQDLKPWSKESLENF